MKEKMERFSKGDFDYELPFLYLSEESIEITVESGKIHEGSFIISNSTQKPMKGIVSSSHRLLTLKKTAFFGAENEIFYQFNAGCLKNGDTVQGEINIISDCGEQRMSFVVHVEAPYYMTSLGKIKDLFQFTNLARMDWSEAKKIFRSEGFERTFLQSDENYKRIYHSLLKSISTSQALEEFLIAIHKKTRIRLHVDKERLEYLVTEDSFMDKLTLTKDQWGYVEIKVSTDADFIQFEQKYIWGDFFLGNTYPISFLLDPKKMRYGNNYGHIWIKTVHQIIEIPVTCRRHRETERQISPEKRSLQVQSALQRNYLKFRLNQIDLAKYLEESHRLLQQLPETADSRIKEFLQIHLAIITDRNSEAEQLLGRLAAGASELKEQSVIWYCVYLYLKALHEREEESTRKAADSIREFYEHGYYHWQMLWFLLYIDRRYEDNRGLKLMDMKEQFTAGNRSPVLYYEAACIYNAEPYLLRELTAYEIQVLNFSIKNKLVTKEVAQQYAYLANRKKHFHPIIFRGLVLLYEVFPITEILTVICCMLIKGIKKAGKYHKWFRLGVEAQLPITELYEYFMYSHEENAEEQLPQSVLLYFIYNSSLSDNKRAYLYAYVIKNRHKNESIFRTYYKKMELFTAKQLEAHNINRSLAVLYREFYGNGAVSAEAAAHLPYVIYRQEFICNNPSIVGIVVTHEELELEENIPLTDGRAWVDIFSKTARIFPVDTFGNRYTVSMDYTIQPLMKPEDYEEICINYSNHPKLLIHLFDRCQRDHIFNERATALRKKVLSIDGINRLYYYDCLEALVDYYYEYYNDELLEYYLSLIAINEVRPEKRLKLLEYMVKRCFYEKVLDALEIFGYEELSVNLLVKFCSGWLSASGGERKQELMVHLCYYVFNRNKYDEAILKYLVRYFFGPTKEMFRIWKAAKGFEVDTHMLEERLLVQMLYTEGYVQDSFLIFKEYYKNVTNRTLVRAFLSFYAYKYLIHDWVINTELFPIMRREINYEENDLCLLAWIKYHSNTRKFSENDQIFLAYQIHRLVKKGIVLSFFERYKGRVKLPDSILNKYYIEYKTDPKKQVYIHYRLLDAEDSGEYITERMPNVFMGIHGKEFVLFYHEVLQYYITEEYGEEVTITESIQVHNEKEPSEEESRYNQINLMLLAKEMHDEATLLDLMEHYVKTEFLVSKCFQPIEHNT